MDSKRPLLPGDRAHDGTFSPRRLGATTDNTEEPLPTDTAWAVAFKANVIITVLSALYFGGTGVAALNDGRSLAAGDDGRRLSSSGYDDGGGGGGGGGLLFLALAFAGVIFIGWAFVGFILLVVTRCSRQILQVAYLGFAGAAGVATVSALFTGHWLAWILPALSCAWCLRFFLKRQSRIRFSSANLKVAALAVKSMPWTIRAALIMGGVQMLWVLLSAAAAGGSVFALQTVTAPGGTVYAASACHNVRDGGSAGSGRLSCQCHEETVAYNSPCVYDGGAVSFWLAAFWVASLVWGAAVFQNVVTATVTGSVASWWFSPGDVDPVRGALHRATQRSFGSLCKAAAVSTAVRLFVGAARRISKAGRWASFLLDWVQNVVDYALAYAICFISIYGLSFSQAGQRVSELFKRRGVTTIANDVVVDVGFAALILGAALFYVAAAWLLLSVFVTAGTYAAGLVWTILVFGLFVVAIVVATTLEVVRSSYKAVFVCFVQDPEALAKNHDRQTYDELSRAWREMQAECVGMVSNPGYSGIEDV